MSDIARQTDAMNTDFKQIGKTLAESTKAINTNNQNLVWLYRNGIKIHTDDITKSVIEETKQASATNANYETINQFKKDMNLYPLEFSLILLLTIATPGWFKAITTVATTAIAYIFNSRKDNVNNDN